MVVKEDVFDFSDFDFSGFVQGDLYKNAISAASSRFDYWAYREEFNKAAELAKSSGESSHAEAFLILAGLCSMVLCPELQQNPFKPMFVGPKGRSLLPEDLSKEQVYFLGGLIDVVDDVFVKARLGELLWLVEKPKNQKRAVVSVDSYLEMPMSPESWIWVKECWIRAVVLARSLRDSDRVDLIKNKLVNAIFTNNIDEAGFITSVAHVLRDNRLGADRRVEVAERLESIAKVAVDERSKRDALEEAAEWFRLEKIDDRAAVCISRVADSYVDEAEERYGAEEGAVVANAMMEKAIQKYRSIPSTQRDRLGVAEKINRLRKRQQEIGASVIEGMNEVSMSFDVTEFVEGVRKAVGMKEVLHAFLVFVARKCFNGVEDVRDRAISLMKAYPIRWLFPGRYQSMDGRLVATHPPVQSYEMGDKAVERAAAEQFARDIDFHAQAFIVPALMVIRNEHWLAVEDFAGLARESPIVPVGREEMWAIGLHAGYEGDFVVALHVLVPQIEHMVRVHLKEAGVLTSTVDKGNIATENGLSTLVQCPEAVGVFGEDLLFEIKYLLCSPLYANLRNDIAHGLLSCEACHSTAAIYCWWLALRLVFLAWWNGLAVERQRELMPSLYGEGRENGC